ncbi:MULTISPECIES: LacI family DNA-binding transcriptional regulator [unclassified Ruegeria]|uniref:LacI family DNA-binding transcriptional regulator n=1 Tax=unclassified Ruegeria TaxID=2625375 RepID=UPI0014899E4B|nr:MULTISPECIES: LacI family DNA-binding transcriptional regulator [unclassified Ruegeria]
MRPTTKDLAKAAGVSLATVDRVLNNRPGVRKKTVKAVNEAIDKIGFVRNLSAANLAKSKRYRFRFMLPRRGDLFISELRERISETDRGLAAEGIEISHQEISQADPHLIARTLLKLSPDKVDGIALMAPESPQVRDAAIRLQEKGVQVVHLISGQLEMSDMDFVGIDNRAAGATAARLIGRFICGRQGKVMVVSETMNARDSLERRHGFDQVLKQDYPNLIALPSLETHGDQSRAQEIVLNTLRNNQDVIAAYIMSSEARSPLNALHCKTDHGELVVIAHELTERTRSALLNKEVDAIIAQNPGHLVRSSVRLLRARCDNREIMQSQEQIRIEILIQENLIPDGFAASYSAQ